MKSALKKELAIATGLLAVWGYKSRSPVLTGLLSAAATGLFVSSLQKHLSFNKQRVYITGGSRGLGLSLAWNLLEQGAQVTLAARDREELIKARDILLKSFPSAKIYISPCDVTETKELGASLDQAIEDMGGIDLLVNNAGSILVGPFSSMEREDFEAQMKLHLYAAIDATSLIFPHFKFKGGGRILNISSLGGKVAVPHMLPYDASKFALAGYSQGVSAELAPHNIVVTTAFPTVMRTGSPIQAVFKGNHEKEFEWFQAIDTMPFLSMGADTAAKKILAAVASEKSEVILSTPGKIRVAGGSFFPEIMNAVMGLAAKLLPKEDSRLRKTGEDSKAIFEKSAFMMPLRNRVRNSQIIYNQAPHHDAEYNMGLPH